MIYSDFDIKARLARGDFSVSPIEPSQIQPASIDIRLGSSFKVPLRDTRTNENGFSFDSPIDYTEVEVTSGKFVLPPHCFALATTMETISLPRDMVAFVEGRSSIGRLGLFIQNAGWVDPGFVGEITLELFNATNKPIVLEVGRRVGQLVFAATKNPCEKPYNGKYQNQTGATGSRIYEDEESAK